MGAPAAVALFDDRSTLPVALAEGEWAGWRFAELRRVSDATLTAARETPEGAVEWQYSDDGETWIPAATTHLESLPAGRTVPFSFAEPFVARAVRVRASAPVVLAQLELFDL